MRTWECIGLMLLFAYKSDASKRKFLIQSRWNVILREKKLCCHFASGTALGSGRFCYDYWRKDSPSENIQQIISQDPQVLLAKSAQGEALLDVSALAYSDPERAQQALAAIGNTFSTELEKSYALYQQYRVARANDEPQLAAEYRGQLQTIARETEQPWLDAVLLADSAMQHTLHGRNDVGLTEIKLAIDIAKKSKLTLYCHGSTISRGR